MQDSHQQVLYGSPLRGSSEDFIFIFENPIDPGPGGVRQLGLGLC